MHTCIFTMGCLKNVSRNVKQLLLFSSQIDGLNYISFYRYGFHFHQKMSPQF